MHEGGSSVLLLPSVSDLCASRSTKIYSLNNVLGEWVVETKPVTYSHDSLANPIKNYILDYDTGAELVASGEAFAQVTPAGNKPAGSLWLAISKRAIRAQVNFNGEKTGKVDLVDTDEVHCAVVFTKNGKTFLFLLEWPWLNLVRQASGY